MFKIIKKFFVISLSLSTLFAMASINPNDIENKNIIIVMELGVPFICQRYIMRVDAQLLFHMGFLLRPNRGLVD